MTPSNLKGSALAAALLVAVGLSGCDSQKQAPQQPRGASPVSVIEVTPETRAQTTILQGRTTPYLVAEVRPQVAGILQKRLFTEGAEVKEGQPLYQIDPAIYQAAVDTAKAEVERAESVVYQTRNTANRYASLVKTNAISKQNNDDAQAAYKQAQAALAAARAQLKNAQINLDYTTITSPISGKIGRSLVTPGALLSAHQANSMAVVQTLDPIYVDVTESSRDLLKLKKDVANGSVKTTNDTIPVTLTLEDGTPYAHKGRLELSEVSVDQGTGTVTMRAVFPNPEQLLLPGMYVRTQLPQGIRENAIFIPQKAVMRQSNGTPYVYVIEEGKVAMRPIKTLRTEGTDWLVESGVKPGEKIVIEGFQRIRPGAPVQIVPTMEEAAKQKAAQQK